MQTLLSFLVLGDASGLSGAGFKRRRRNLSELTKTNHALYKHHRAQMYFYGMHNKRARIREFITIMSKLYHD